MNKCIIFDCDGVLVDTEIIANQHCVDFYAEHGYYIAPQEAMQRFTGKTMEDVQTYILETSGISIPGHKWFESDCREKLYKAFSESLKPLMVHTLDNLAKHKIPRCVASNSHHERIHKALDFTNQRSYFEEHHIFSAQQVERPKPSPDLFLFAAEQMGFHPTDCVVIEDSTTGIEAALAAQISVIGFLGGAHAQHDWYQSKIHAYNIPTAKDSEELWRMLSTAS